MSTTIDQQVVEMRFDNKQFENNVSTTMSTLDKLKQSLNLSGASKGLSGLASTAGMTGESMKQLEYNACQAGFSFRDVWLKVSNVFEYQVAGRIISAGKKMISALTIDPIKTGFSEYETQINAVQTILANTESKGTTLQDVNRALDELNTYADKTIYNFTEMTRNIGTFTAAGVDLDTSVTAIQGIANLAAVSGSTSQQASTAMYQLSQALSSGTVKLMDWNSVVNAGMGGQVFQDALKETARNQGVAIDELIKKNGSFRETLQEGWLTADILTETLSHFTMAAEEGSEAWDAYKKSLMDDGYTEQQAENILKLSNTATNAATKVKTFSQLWDTLKEAAQSGWTQSWEIIVGDFEEAKGFLTDISDRIGAMIGASADARNKMLSGGLSSGWKQLLGEGIADEEGYKDTFKQVANAHNVSIDDMIAAEKKLDDSLSDTEAFQKALTTGIKEGTITSDMFSDSVHIMADKMGAMSAEELKAAGYTTEHVKQIEELSKGLKDGSVSMDEFVKKMSRPSGRENIIQALWNAFDGLMSVVTPVKEALSEIFPPITGEQLYSFTEKLKEFTSKLTLSETASENLKRTFKGLFAVLDIIKEVFVAVFKAIGPLFGGVDNLGGGILSVTAKIGDWLVALRDSIKEGNVFGKAVEKIHAGFAKIKDFLAPMIETIKRFGSVFSKTIGSAATTATERLGPLAILGNFIKGVFVGIGKAVEKTFSFIFAAAKGIGNLLSELMGYITSAIQDANFDGLFDMINGGIFAAIGVYIAKFIKSGGDLLDNAGGFMEGIKDVLGGASDALGAFQDSLKADVLKKIAIAIGILAASLLVLSLIPSEKLNAALVAITALFGELMGSMAIFSKIIGGDGFKGIGKLSAALISISASLLILSIALKIMSTMSWSEMGVGLISLTVGLGALVGAVNLLPDKKVNGAAKAIKKLSTAILVLAVAIKIMSTMSWSEMGRGLITMVVGLGALVGAVNLLPKDTGRRAAGMIGLAVAMVILGGALKIMASMSWDEIGRGLAALAGSLLILSGAMALMKRSIPGALAMLIIAPALIVLGGALKIMGRMSWDEIGRGLVVLAGSLLILAGAMALMRTALAGAAALVVVTAALVVLAPVLKLLGSMSWGEIARGLVMLAGTFAVLGVAGLVLGPLVPTILALSGALVLLGIGCAAIGVGVVAIAAGLTAIAASGSAIALSVTTIVASLIGLIPYFIEQIGVGIIKLCEVISGSAAAICEAFTVIVLALVDAIVTSVPAVVEGMFVLVDSLLTTLVEYTPSIANKLFDFVIGVLDVISARLPELIQAGVNLLSSLINGIIDAMKGFDTGTLIGGIIAVGLMTGLVAALAAVSGLIGPAMVGLLGVGALIAELALVLAAIGALAQIPGLDWLISEGGDLLGSIGEAIGKFFGGIAKGGMIEIGKGLKGFSDAVDGLDPEAITTVVKAAKALVEMTNCIPNEGGLVSWFTGDNSISKFGTDLIDLGEGLKGFSEKVAGINPETITAAAVAAKALADMASHIPNSGGIVSWFAGENSVAKFGSELTELGKGLKGFSEQVVGVNPETITAAAGAAKVLAEMTNHIPNSGGVASWFAGDNSVSKFGSDLTELGKGLKGFSEQVAGVNPENLTAAAGAAKTLAEMTSYIPNSGGVASWFAGDNSVSKFGADLIALGIGLKGFSDKVLGVNPETLIAASSAAKSLAQMASYIPNEGGVVSWFAGENSISKFGSDLIALGIGLKGFSDQVLGVNPETLIAASNAAKSLAQMTTYIPNSGGVVSWFAGEASVSKFAADLVYLGMGLKGFSDQVTGVNPESLTAAAGAAKTLAEMTTYIPNSGGVVSWFAGENSVSKFGTDLASLGKGMKDFSDKIAGVNPETLTAAAGAAKALAEMTSYIPNEGGLIAWFTGDNSVATFASNLPTLGDGLKDFSDSVDGISPDNITAAANAAKTLAQMASTTPDNSDKIVTFGENLEDFGEDLKDYFDDVSGITSDQIATSNKAIESVKTSTSGLDSGSIRRASSAIDEMVSALKKISKVDASTADGFRAAIKKLGETNVTALVTTFKDAAPKMKNAGDDLMRKFLDAIKNQHSKMKSGGKEAIDKFADGIESQKKTVKNACTEVVSKAVDAIDNYKDDFKSAGKDLGSGLVNGINAKKTAVYQAAYALGQKAVQGEKDGQKSNSPSKLTTLAGKWLGEGLIVGMELMGKKVYNAGADLGGTVTGSISSAVSRIADMVDSGIDAQPTIRPVLDLSDVRAGANAIGSMFGNDQSVGVLANVGSISSMMNYRQNGNTTDDIVSELGKLRRDINNMDRASYIIDGINVSEGTDAADAINTLVRAIKMEGRT